MTASDVATPKSFDPKHLLAAARRHLWIVALFAACATLALIGLMRFLPPAYTATSVVWIDTANARIMASDSYFDAIQPGRVNTSEQSRVIAATLTSVPVLRRVVEELELQNDQAALTPRLSAFLAELKSFAGLSDEDLGPPLAPIAEKAGETAARQPAIPDADGKARAARPAFPLMAASGLVDARDAGLVDARDAGDEYLLRSAVSKIADQLSVEVDMRSELVSISFTALDPALARAIANAVPAAFAVTEAERRRASSGDAVEWLSARVEKLRKEVTAGEQAIARFKAQNGLTDEMLATGNGPVVADAQIALEGARAAAAEARRRLEAALIPSSGDPATQATLFQSPALERLMTLQSDAMGQRAELLARVGQEHALVADIDRRLTSLAAAIEAERRRQIVDLERAVAAADARVSALEAELAASEDDVEARWSTGASALSAFREMEREVAANRSLYQSLLSRLNEARQLNQADPTGVRVVQHALMPLSPSGPSPGLIVAAGAGGALMLGLAGVLGLALFDRTIRHPEQAKALGHDVLAILPKMDRRSVRGPRPGGHGRPSRRRRDRPRLVFDEGIRRLLSATVLSTGRRPVRSILVTSATKSEGKSTVAAAIAHHAAERGIDAVLVEADLRRPGAYARSLARGKGGLFAYLEGTASLEDVMIVDERSGLAVVPTARTVQHSTELLASARMRSLLATLKDRYAFVVVDTSPVCLTSDAEVLASALDGIVFVVRHGDTTTAKARTAFDLIERAVETPIGIVVNMADDGFLQDHYGGGDYVYRASPPPTGPSAWLERLWGGRGRSGGRSGRPRRSPLAPISSEVTTSPQRSFTPRSDEGQHSAGDAAPARW